MRKIIIWGAYPSTLKAVREGVSHIKGLGDNLLWWLAELLPLFAEDGYTVEWGDCIDLSSNKEYYENHILLLLDLPNGRSAITKKLYKFVSPSRRILIRLEPPVIAPDAYTFNTLQKFAALARVEPSINDAAVPHILNFNVPLEKKLPILLEPSYRQGICAVSSHKRILGKRGSLYRIRENSYRLLSKVANSFTLYGAGWNQYVSGIDLVDWILRKLRINLESISPRQVNYRGSIEDKSSIINHEYILVIENYIGKTYLSEKPFDALKYGVVPIYYGGVDLRGQGLGDLVIPVKEVQNMSKIISSLPTAAPIKEIQLRYSDWLNSPNAKKYTIDQCRQDLTNLFETVIGNE